MPVVILFSVVVVAVFVALAMRFPPPDPARRDVYTITCRDGREWKKVEVSMSEGGFYVYRAGELIAKIRDDCIAEKDQ